MAENFFAMIDRVKRNIIKNTKNPQAMLDALDLALVRGREDFNKDPVGMTLESANLGGLSGLAGVIGSTASKGAKMSSFAAPQADALETARRNAVEMLGLPENNTAMDRARAMGFDAPAYHGTAKSGYVETTDIPYFDESKVGDRWGQDSRGFYFTNNKNEANYYARSDRDYRDNGAGNGVVYPVLLNIKNPLNKKTPLDSDNVSFWDSNFEPLQKQALKKNSDSVLLTDAEKNQMSVMFNPNQIRSRFAAFDPARRNEANLLASRLMPFGLAGLLGLNQYNEEQ
jgi:hypothetical protein